ncbi:MAG: hypothetical protein U0271_29850 [Polyangiaceae bacterium]
MSRYQPVLALALAWVACTPALPEPAIAAQPDDAQPLEVPEPPPPARIEIVPDPPAALRSPVWVDGQWKYEGGGWLWHPGGWESGVPARRYARPRIERRPDGQLVWYEGKFLD